MSRRKRSVAGGDPPPVPPATLPAHAVGPALWIYGWHAALAALENPRRRLRRVLLTAEAAKGLKTRPPQAETVDRAALERALPQGAVHQGIAVLAEPLPEPDLDEVLDGVADGRPAALVLLDQVTDPHNVGAILRSAAAFGACAVVVTRHHAPQVTGALAKSASGALEHVPLVRVGNLAQAIERVRESGFWCLALAGEVERTLAAAAPPARTALVLGAEGEGLRRLSRERCDETVRLPTRGPIGQLNVSNAAAVALYEWARQHGGAKPGKASP